MVCFTCGAALLTFAVAASFALGFLGVGELDPNCLLHLGAAGRYKLMLAIHPMSHVNKLGFCVHLCWLHNIIARPMLIWFRTQTAWVFCFVV